MRYITCAILACLLFLYTTKAQTLSPGFNAEEYAEMLRVILSNADTAYLQRHSITMPIANDYHLAYQAPETGLRNQWSLFVNSSNTILVINLRGTVNAFPSWLENFYSAMIPANGSLQLDDSTVFHYRFAADPKAAVHVGWALGVGSMAPAITQKIQAYYNKGIKQLLIIGHSQGGALAFLLTSYLHYQVEAHALPEDLLLKTYCSAAPKPGNLYYAYDYDFITRNGWSFTVVNAADWVPETPFSIQTTRDYTTVNPFTNVAPLLKKQPFFIRLYLKHVYSRLDKTTHEAQTTYTQYLGKTLYKEVKKYLPHFRQPVYYPSMNYMRAGVPIVLQPDEAYRKAYPDSTQHLFMHHGIQPYYELVERIYLKK